MKMVNVNTSLSIDERYVEYLPSGDYGGFYQVGDGLRLVPPGIYYWSLPGEFLGDRVMKRKISVVTCWTLFWDLTELLLFCVSYWFCIWYLLGFKLTSYGGILRYDIYYSLGRELSRILDQSDVIMRVSWLLCILSSNENCIWWISKHSMISIVFFIWFQGNGITLYHRSSTIAVADGRTRFEVPLLPVSITLYIQ